MKGVLQYCDTVDGTYKNVGTLRSAHDNEFVVKDITRKDRVNQEHVIGNITTIQAKCLELNTDFLDATGWFFRFIFPDQLQMVLLGYRRYKLHQDYLVGRNTIMYNVVQLEFGSGNMDGVSYIPDNPERPDPEDLPEDEGGIVVDDSAIYID